MDLRADFEIKEKTFSELGFSTTWPMLTDPQSLRSFRQKEFCRYLGCFCRIGTVALWIIFVAKLGCCVPSLNACDVVLANTREVRAKLGGVLSEVDVFGSDPDRAMGPTDKDLT